MGDRDRRWVAVYAHRERLLRLARARLGNAQDAEDVVQEAMLRCVEFAALDEERLGQFLTTVTVRLCADVHRGRQRGERLSRRLGGFWANEPGPEESVCDRAESAWLSRLLEQLTPKQRAIVEARAEGLSCGAVAERLVVPYTTVESAMARVRRSLRVALESTMGVVAFRVDWSRLRRLSAGVATASAAAVTVGQVGGHLPERAGPEAAARPPVVAPADDSATRPDRAAAAGDRARGTTARPAPTDRVPTRSTTTPPRRTATTRPTGGVGIDGAPGARSEEKEHEFTFAERVEHCARYGVAAGDPSIQCRYPSGHPNNEEEYAGTPRPEGGLP